MDVRWINALRARSFGWKRIATELGVGVGTIYRFEGEGSKFGKWFLERTIERDSPGLVRCWLREAIYRHDAGNRFVVAQLPLLDNNGGVFSGSSRPIGLGECLFAESTSRAVGFRPSRRRLAAPVIISLALLSFFFLLQVAPHSHADGHDEAACRICQVAHIGVAPTVSAVPLNPVLVYFGEIVGPPCLHFADSFSAQSPSRAPPALTA